MRWVFVAVRGLSLVAVSGGYSSLWCTGFSLRWLLLLQSTGSRPAGSVVVAHGLSSCGARAQLLRSMWDLPRPGLEHVSPALAGGFLTTVPLGKSEKVLKANAYGWNLENTVLKWVFIFSPRPASCVFQHTDTC